MPSKSSLMLRSTRRARLEARTMPSLPRSVFRDLASDDEALNVAGALVDLAYANVAVDALDREIGDIAVAAMDLDRVGGDAFGHLRGEELGHRRLFDARFASVAPRRGVEHQAVRRSDLGRHVGEAEGHRLLLDDRLAEGRALAGIGEGGLISGARHPDRLRSDPDAAAFQVGERNLVAFAFRAQHQIGGQLDLLEDELGGVGGALAELVLDPGHPKTGAVGRYEKGADAPLALFGVGHREDDSDLRVLAGGDELLGTAQHPAVAVASRPRLDRRCVGAGLRLCQAKAGEHLAFRHRPEEPPLLLLRPVLQDRHAADRVLHAENRRDRTLPSSDLLHDEGVADMVGARPAIFLGHQHAHKPELAELGDRIGRKFLLAIPLRRMRHEPFARKVAGDIAQHALLLGEAHEELPRFAVTSISIFMRGSTSPQKSAVAAGRTVPKSSPSTGTMAGQSAGFGT